jgi:hypothetical protein
MNSSHNNSISRPMSSSSMSSPMAGRNISSTPNKLNKKVAMIVKERSPLDDLDVRDDFSD